MHGIVPTIPEHPSHSVSAQWVQKTYGPLGARILSSVCPVPVGQLAGPCSAHKENPPEYPQHPSGDRAHANHKISAFKVVTHY